MESLKSDCADILSSTLTVATVINVLLLADKYNVSKLKTNCIKYILENDRDVTQTDDWEQLANTNPMLRIEVIECQLIAKLLKANPNYQSPLINREIFPLQPV